MDMDKSLENVNIAEICRACFEVCEQYKKLTDDAENFPNRKLGDIFFDVVQIELKSNADISPSRLCLPCSKDLLSANKFIQKCQQNNERFLEFLRNTNIKQPDCLSEFPIDIPTGSHSSDLLQIKIETEELTEFTADTLTDEKASAHSSSDSEASDYELPRHEVQKINKMQCVYCDRVFKRADFLENHRRKHEEEFKRKGESMGNSSLSVGDESGTVCNTATEQNTHGLTNRPNRKKAKKKRKSQIQESKITTRSQGKKVKPISGRFECDSCSKSFAWKKDLYRHERCHKPNTKKFSCPHCERRFLRKDKLNSHLLVHLAGITKSNPLFSFQYFAQCLFSEKKFKHLKCMICNYDSASNVHKLRSHIVSHKNLELVEDLGNSSVVKRFYPDKDLKEVILLIKDQIEENQLGKLYSIINENTFEMGISDSDESDPDSEHQYSCEVCYESFNRKHKVMTHQANEHSFQECPYKCGKCKLKFTCQEIFKSHLKHHCENPDKEYICRKCPGRFTWPTNFENHECRKRNTKTTELKKKSTACEVCEKVFTCLRDLRIHKKTHIPGDKSRNCLICGETFFRPQDLRCHLKTHSKSETISRERKILCMLCQEKFQTIIELKQHLYIHSDGERDVNFENCEFITSFHPDADKSVITDNIRICFRENRLWQFYMVINKFGLEGTLSDSDSEAEKQTSEVPSETYICELCDMKFPRMQAILQHQYDHGQEINNFPYKCDNCKEQFVCEALLRRHVKNECLNPYRKHACTKCGIKFTWKTNLDAHLCILNEKSSEDNKTCEICGKKFIWLKDLHRHKRTHIPDGKKFECLVCEKKFNRKDNLRAHMKIHAIDYKQKPNTEIKWEQQDENMCRPHGEKIIQCKICFSKHNTIRDLGTHLLTHKNPNTLGQEESNVMALSMLLYNKQMDLRTLSQTISKDLTCGTNDHFYSITNEMGYELNLMDSETCTDMESNDDDDDDGNRDGVDISKGYICKLCNTTFDRKFKIFEHQKNDHLWEELPFECVHCSAKFVCESLHQHHLQYNCENAEKQFKCKRCPLKFMWKENLKIHEKYLHDKNPILPKKHRCNSCDKSFLWYKDLLRHKKNHQNNERKFECTWCFRVFMRSDNLKVHMKVHQNATHLLLPDIYYLARPNGSKIAQCKHCDQKYSTIYELLEHIQMIHLTYQLPGTIPNPTSYSITNALGYEMDIEDSETEREEITEKYICELCGAQFNRRFKLLQHQQSLHYSDNIPHKCNQCNFKCVSEPVLGYHMRTQCKNALKQFCCSKCTMRFMWEENLENHESLIHDSRRTHTCGVCKQDFATHHDLKSHNDCKPPVEIKIFECNLCNRKYNRKDRLMKHKKVHSTGPKEAQAKSTQSTDKKFLCAFCGKEVSSSSNLVIHMRRHTGEKPFKCEFCNKGFPRSSDLSCHRRTHTGEKPHKCLVCGKAFSRSYKLQTHKRVHSGERPYKCSYCEKSFTQSNDLTLHVRRHTGERPYICEICGERFIQGTALRNHRRMRGHYEI